MLVEAALVFVVALFGGLLPLAGKWTDRRLHAAVALSTGVFLGAVFLHLLPSLSHVQVAPSTTAQDAAGHATHAHVQGQELHLWAFVLLGLLGVYLVEGLLLRSQDHDDLHRHRAVGYAALLGLCAHALMAGVGLAATREHTDQAAPVFLAVVGHKGFEAFSLTSVFQLAEADRRRIGCMIVLFALVTPLGMLAGYAITDVIGEYGLAILTALAAGTFLFVSLCELLPEVFHHREDGLLKTGLLAAGVLAMALFPGAVS